MEKIASNPVTSVAVMVFSALILKENYSEIIVFANITNFTRNSVEESVFPGDFWGAKSLENFEKKITLREFISCESVTQNRPKNMFFVFPHVEPN